MLSELPLDAIPLDPSMVETTVETHEPPKEKSFLERAKEKLTDGISGETPDEGEPKRKSKGAPGYLRPEQRDELATLVSSGLVLILAAANVPDDLAPSDDERDGVSEHLVKILARHVDLSKKLSGDVLDIIGIIAITSSYYRRIAPVLAERRALKTVKGQAGIPPAKMNGGVKVNDPIPDAAVNTFLDAAKNSAPPDEPLP